MYAPPPGPDAVYCTLYNRHEAFAELAFAELQGLSRSQGDAAGESVEPGVFLSRTPIRWAETGFGLAGGRQLAASADLREIREQLLAHRLVAPAFGMDVRRIPKHVKGAQALKQIVAACVDGNPDYANPQLRLLLVVSTRGYRVLLDEAPGDPGWTEIARKPHNLFVALPVRIARAALNLTARPGESVFDPFCGSGTIPLVAAHAGHPAYGSDISGEWVAKAQANAAHFGLDVGRGLELSTCDAIETEQRADCIVTNPPYGTYSHLGEGGMSATLTNLRRLAPRITLVSTEPLTDILTDHGYEVTRVISVERERFERFVYLTRVSAGRRVGVGCTLFSFYESAFTGVCEPRPAGIA